MGIVWPWSGWPPTGVMVALGAATGLRAADYEASVGFYDTAFDALGVTQSTNSPGTWAHLLVVRAESTEAPATQNADLFIAASSARQLDDVVSALRSADLLRGFDSGETSDEDRTVTWVSFLDPDGNSVWVASASPAL